MVGAFGIPTVAAVGILFVLPSVGRSAAFCRRGCILTPFHLTPPYGPSVGLWRGLFLLLFQNLLEELAFNSFFGPGLQFFKFCVRECGGVSVFGKNG